MHCISRVQVYITLHVFIHYSITQVLFKHISCNHTYTFQTFRDTHIAIKIYFPIQKNRFMYKICIHIQIFNHKHNVRNVRKPCAVNCQSFPIILVDDQRVKLIKIQEEEKASNIQPHDKLNLWERSELDKLICPYDTFCFYSFNPTSEGIFWLSQKIKLTFLSDCIRFNLNLSAKIMLSWAWLAPDGLCIFQKPTNHQRTHG